jgi:hypothetical protein
MASLLGDLRECLEIGMDIWRFAMTLGDMP